MQKRRDEGRRKIRKRRKKEAGIGGRKGKGDAEGSRKEGYIKPHKEVC